MRTSMIMAALALALGACGSDKTIQDTGTKDTGTKDTGAKDTGAKVDQVVTGKDTGPANELRVTLDGAGPYTCVQISYCAKPCGIDLTCVDKCSAKGCQSAKDAFTKLRDCSVAKCLLDCFSGFTDPCAACAAKSCPTEYGACQSSKC